MTRQGPGKAGKEQADMLPARQPAIAPNAVKLNPVRKHRLKLVSLITRNHTQLQPAKATSQATDVTQLSVMAILSCKQTTIVARA